MKIVRHHYRDEEPDVDEVRGEYFTYLDAIAGTCKWCGHSDHRSSDCPNCPRGEQTRRTRAQQLAAVRRGKPLDGPA